MLVLYCVMLLRFNIQHSRLPDATNTVIHILRALMDLTFRRLALVLVLPVLFWCGRTDSVLIDEQRSCLETISILSSHRRDLNDFFIVIDRSIPYMLSMCASCLRIYVMPRFVCDYTI